LNENDNKSLLYDIDSSSIIFCGGKISIRKDMEIIKIQVRESYTYILGCMGTYENNFIKWINRVFNMTDYTVKDYVPGANGLLILPFMMGGSMIHDSDLRGSIIGINNNKIQDILTASYEAIGFSLKNKLSYLQDIGVNFDSIKILKTLSDKMFYQILSDITGKKIILENRYEDNLHFIFNMISNKKWEPELSQEILIPNKDRFIIYKQLFNYYKGSCKYLNDIYKYRRKNIKEK
jgi:sugar (pentulose or hexulose) kinase